ncbi:iron-siderophore ABC transporter substrate-binding protein [Guyparkeria sp. SCN-R1]|uniref:iron-siderophore ABC transporter substrate-binding protein n=1 Tax=Guyparkeria sp. SCN-R1 TaxID=2341113 RepID=UPI000F655DE6|nr:iron-siderophore ABC transporter substrate-binding protein [Guyparkeria sp. SCN-R1]RRQ23835.1 iron-siderophore ABC transporter substrate-binding protein [Guyparkeria sp. SCN-R1]
MRSSPNGRRRWRWPLAVWLLPLLMAALSVRAADTAPRIATLDWTVAETLIAIDARLVGLAQLDGYASWVARPAVPSTVRDLGLRAQPNFEQLAAIAPDRIALSPLFANLEGRLSTVAPVEVFELYGPGVDTWPALRRVTRELGEYAHRQGQAEALIRRTEDRLDEIADRLPDHPPAVIVVQFMDERHVRVFGQNGLYHAVLGRLGIDNGWTGATNRWGFSLVGLEALVGLDGRIVVVKPYPVGVERALSKSAFWQRLTHGADRDPLELEPVWSFGGLPSAGRFAEQLLGAFNAD